MCSILEGFPGGPEVKNLACNAGDTSSIPDGGTKIPRAARQVRLSPQLLNLLTTTGESVWHSLRSHMMPLRPDTNKYIYIYIFYDSPGGSDSKASAYNAGDPGSVPGSGDLLEKEMATHSSTLAWKIPWMEEPGWLQSMGSQRVRQD